VLLTGDFTNYLAAGWGRRARRQTTSDRFRLSPWHEARSHCTMQPWCGGGPPPGI